MRMNVLREYSMLGGICRNDGKKGLGAESSRTRDSEWCTLLSSADSDGSVPLVFSQ